VDECKPLGGGAVAAVPSAPHLASDGLPEPLAWSGRFAGGLIAGLAAAAPLLPSLLAYMLHIYPAACRRLPRTPLAAATQTVALAVEMTRGLPVGPCMRTSSGARPTTTATGWTACAR